MPPRRAWIWLVLGESYLVLLGVGMARLIERQASWSTVDLVLAGCTLGVLLPIGLGVEVVVSRRLRHATPAQKGAAASTRGGSWASLGSLLAIMGGQLSWSWLELFGFVMAFAGVGMLWRDRPWATPAGKPPDGAGEV